jgi:hypothetical protein
MTNSLAQGTVVRFLDNYRQDIITGTVSSWSETFGKYLIETEHGPYIMLAESLHVVDAEGQLRELKLTARNALQRLIASALVELGNLERFEDARQLIATADIKMRFDEMEQAADAFSETWNAIQEVR